MQWIENGRLEIGGVAEIEVKTPIGRLAFPEGSGGVGSRCCGQGLGVGAGGVDGVDLGVAGVCDLAGEDSALSSVNSWA